MPCPSQQERLPWPTNITRSWYFVPCLTTASFWQPQFSKVNIFCTMHQGKQVRFNKSQHLLFLLNTLCLSSLRVQQTACSTAVPTLQPDGLWISLSFINFRGLGETNCIGFCLCPWYTISIQLCGGCRMQNPIINTSTLIKMSFFLNVPHQIRDSLPYATQPSLCATIVTVGTVLAIFRNWTTPSLIRHSYLFLS